MHESTYTNGRKKSSLEAKNVNFTFRKRSLD